MTLIAGNASPQRPLLAHPIPQVVLKLDKSYEHQRGPPPPHCGDLIPRALWAGEKESFVWIWRPISIKLPLIGQQLCKPCKRDDRPGLTSMEFSPIDASYINCQSVSGCHFCSSFVMKIHEQQLSFDHHARQTNSARSFLSLSLSEQLTDSSWLVGYPEIYTSQSHHVWSMRLVKAMATVAASTTMPVMIVIATTMAVIVEAAMDRVALFVSGVQCCW